MKVGNDVAYFNISSQHIRFIYANNPRGYFGRDNEVDHITNSWGFRGQEFSLEKPQNTFRIAFLGDSFTFGEGVWFDDTYAQQVSLILHQKYKSLPINFESYNFGVGGYNVNQALFVLTRIALETNPDVVVLKCSVDDTEPRLFEIDNNTNRIIRSPRWNENSQGITNPLPPDKLIYKLRLTRLFWQAFQNTRQTDKMITYYKLLYADKSNDWSETRKSLREIARICKEKMIPCYVVCFPILYQLNDRYPFGYIHSIIQKETEDAGIFFVDLLLDFKNIDAKKLWVHVTDHHPNEIAHKRAAEAIVRAMLSNEDIVEKVYHLGGVGSSKSNPLISR